jgi:ABC-type polysaccharide/polyol phosphate transport system ATPase subunit
MVSITLKDVSLTYPIFDSKSVEDSPEGAGRIESRQRGGLGLRALRDINLSIGQGDRVGLIGRNGSGKSTLLRVMAGIYAPDAGELIVEGQTAGLFEVGLGMRIEATGRRNIVLRALMEGDSRAEAEARVDAIADFVELRDFLDLPVRTYSQGMMMRLAFALTTSFGADIALLDEWIGAGDKDFRRKADARMQEIVDKAGIVVLASHNPELVLKHCEQAIWLDQGIIKMAGAGEDIVRAYEDSGDS